MKLAKIAMAVIALVASNATMAGNLTASQNVTIEALDGLRLKSGVKPQINDEKVHQVVVTAGDIIDGSYYSVNPIVLTFNGSTEDISIVAPTIRSQSDATKFVENPTFEIKTASGKVLAHKQDKLRGEGFAPNSRVEENLAKYNASKGIASVPEFTNVVLEAKGQMVVQTDNVKEDQLQLLFKKADKETQQRFLEWAKKNAK